jgi:hypothetical protein
VRRFDWCKRSYSHPEMANAPCSRLNERIALLSSVRIDLTENPTLRELSEVIETDIGT